MTYDESIARAEAIIAQLENAEALSMEEYKRLSSEATKLLRSCKEEIESLVLKRDAKRGLVWTETLLGKIIEHQFVQVHIVLAVSI